MEGGDVKVGKAESDLAHQLTAVGVVGGRPIVAETDLEAEGAQLLIALEF